VELPPSWADAHPFWAGQNLFMIRLDQALVERGLCESREKAKRAILAGQVRVNAQTAHKASDSVKAEDEITLDAPEKYVSRGGHKLEHALKHFQLDVAGRWRLISARPPADSRTASCKTARKKFSPWMSGRDSLRGNCGGQARRRHGKNQRAPFETGSNAGIVHPRRRRRD
jgi:ribosomal protein S4